MEDEIKPNVVIDNGSAICKIGFRCEEGPSSTFPNVIGILRNEVSPKTDFYVGAKAIEKKGILDIEYPIKNGIIYDWDQMTKIWEHCFSNELRTSPEDQKCMLLEAQLNPNKNRQKIGEIMFETFNVPALSILSTPFCCLLARGKLDGLVCEFGDGLTQIVPFFDGHPIPEAINKMEVNGRVLTKYLRNFLVKYNKKVFGDLWNNFELFKAIKEEACYVALDYEKEKGNEKEFQYELPDGYTVTIQKIRIDCPECLFKPEKCRKDCDGLGQQCFDSIMKTSMELHKNFYSSIYLAGGNSCFEGLAERLTEEIEERIPQTDKGIVKVSAIPDRKYAAWIGGSILSSISSFESSWLKKEEYDESGSSIILKKFIQ